MNTLTKPISKNKMVRVTYTQERLQQVCLDRGICLHRDDYEKLMSETEIECYCTKCGGEMTRSFRLIVMNGALCIPCGKAARFEKSKQTNLEKYGCENPM